MIKDENASTSATKTDVAEWTIMIYMSADNDLTDECIRALSETKSARFSNKINVIAQLDPHEPRMKTKRFAINKKASGGGESAAGGLDEDSIDLLPGKTDFKGPKSTSIASTGDINMAEPKTLFDFVSRCLDLYPARHYMLVLDGHASGVEEGFLLKDQNPPGSMSLDDLRNVLAAIKDELKMNIDVLGLDACLMNMLEICYEFKGLAAIMVGSQGLTPGHGWPFAKIIYELNRNPITEPEQLAAEQLARIIVRQFTDSYLDNSIIGGLSVDIAALRLTDTDTVAKTLNDLAGFLVTKLNDPNVRDQIILSHWRAQSFNGELYVDLWDFCEVLKVNYKSNENGDVFKKCSAVQDAIQAMRVASCFCGIEYQHAHGLSIYFPWSEIFSGYKNLAFANLSGKDSNWFNFISKYLELTRREPLGGSGIQLNERVRRDPPWKRDPPYMGPGEIVHSMRNPPRDYPQNVDCVPDLKRLDRLLKTFRLKI